jgi:hypothetical protein
MDRHEMKAVMFGHGSNVRAYWLANAEGFEVVPRTILRQRVESVVVDAARGHAKALIVRSSFRRRRRILRAERVTAVDPFARVVYLAHKQQQQQQRSVAGAWIVSALIGAGVRSGQTMAQLLRAVAARLLAALVWLLPRLRQATRTACRHGYELGLRVIAAAAWLRPRLRAQASAAGVAALALGAAAAEASRRLGARLAHQTRSSAPRRRPRRRPPHAEARQTRRRYAARWERSRGANAVGRLIRSRPRNNTF